MASSSKNKGDGYERELANFLADQLGLPIQRTPLSGGGRNDAQLPDLTGVPDVWVEAKRTERFEPRKAMTQALAGKRARHCPDMPIVVNRRNREPTSKSLVVMHLDDWLRIYRAYLKVEGVKTHEDPIEPEAEPL